jgi:hypothetical protein
MAKIANVALTDTFNTWRTRTNTVLDRVSQFAINNSSLYANTLTSNVAFTAKGTATVTGLFTASGRATVGTNLTVSGNTTITGLTTMSGRATVGTNLTVSGNTTLGGASKTITMGGAASTLTIGGAGHTTNATGWFGVAGRATVSTNLFVGGNTAIGGGQGLAGKFSVQSGVSYFATQAGTYNTALFGPRPANDGYGTLNFNWTTSGTGNFWIIDYSSGTFQFNAYKAGVSIPIMTLANTGGVNMQKSMSVTQNLTVSGNTTLSGTINVAGANILQQTLADGATVNWNVALGQIATVTLGGNRTMAAPTNLKVGTYILHVYQDGTGSRTLTWNSVFKWTAASAPPLTSAINSHDVFSFVSDGTYLYGSFMPDVR